MANRLGPNAVKSGKRFKTCLRIRSTLPLAGGSDEKSGEGLNEMLQLTDQLPLSGPERPTLPRESNLASLVRLHFQTHFVSLQSCGILDYDACCSIPIRLLVIPSPTLFASRTYVCFVAS